MLLMQADVERAVRSKSRTAVADRANHPEIVDIAAEANTHKLPFDDLDQAKSYLADCIAFMAKVEPQGDTPLLTDEDLFVFYSDHEKRWHAGTILRAYHFSEWSSPFGPEFPRRWNSDLVNDRLGGATTFIRNLQAAFQQIGLLDKQYARKRAAYEARVNDPARRAAERQMQNEIKAVSDELAGNGIVIMPGIWRGDRLHFETAQKPAGYIGDHAIYEVSPSWREWQRQDADRQIQAIREKYKDRVDPGEYPTAKHQSFIGEHDVRDAVTRILANDARVCDVNGLLHAITAVNHSYGFAVMRGNWEPGRSGLSNLDHAMQYIFDAVSIAYGLDVPAEHYFWCFDHESGIGLPSIPFADSVVFTRREIGHDFEADRRFPWHEVADTSKPRFLPASV